MPHTPGPWRYLRHDNIIVTGDALSRIADFQPRSLHVSEAERDANGFLIAAAPELLDALKRVVAVTDRKTNEFDAAHAAIAKAEGAKLA